MKKIGRITFTYESLAALLGIPADHKITAIVPQRAEDVAWETISVLVAGPKLPDHHEGSAIMCVGLTRDCHGKTHFS